MPNRSRWSYAIGLLVVAAFLAVVWIRLVVTSSPVALLPLPPGTNVPEPLPDPDPVRAGANVRDVWITNVVFMSSLEEGPVFVPPVRSVSWRGVLRGPVGNATEVIDPSGPPGRFHISAPPPPVPLDLFDNLQTPRF